MFSSKMESNVYVLGASVEDRVLGYLDTRLVVFVKGWNIETVWALVAVLFVSLFGSNLIPDPCSDIF